MLKFYENIKPNTKENIPEILKCLDEMQKM